MKKSLGARTLVFPTPVWVVGTYHGVGRLVGRAYSIGKDIRS